jgi:hypothetical protein
VRAQSEREGKDVRLRAQLSGGGRMRVCGLQKRLGRVGAWPGNARSWACPRRNDADRRGPPFIKGRMRARAREAAPRWA